MKAHKINLLAIMLSMVAFQSTVKFSLSANPSINKILADFGRFRLSNEPLQTEGQTLQINVEEIGNASPQEPVQRSLEKSTDVQEEKSEEQRSFSASSHPSTEPNNPGSAYHSAAAPSAIKHNNGFDNLNYDYIYNYVDSPPSISRVREVDAPQCNVEAISNSAHNQPQPYGQFKNALDMTQSNNDAAEDGEVHNPHYEYESDGD